MPAPVTVTASTSRDKPAKQPATKVDARSRRTRIARRRGRARGGDIDSEDEIERVAMSDDSDISDAQSILDSASDSEPESEAEFGVLRNGHPRIETPNILQSSPAEVDPTSVNVVESKPVAVDNHTPSFLSAGIDWSDMVTDEIMNGNAGLPVIDFADMHEHAASSSRHVSQSPPIQQRDTLQPPVATEDRESDGILSEGGVDGDPLPSTLTPHPPAAGPHRPPGQTARQAYQERLQTDPSFVPTVGEFWGHDDRLLQKDLRSLSGWWRGRWQGRGRGRGGFQVVRGMRGHGRGGFMGDAPPSRTQDDEESPRNGTRLENEETFVPQRDIPPIERAWTHDGFEEMRVKDVRRRADQPQSQQESQQQSQQAFGPGFRGARGGFVSGRGRGNFVNGRGSFMSPTSSRSRPGLPFSPHVRPTDRPWFAMKPERMWTKQHEGFLHLDPALKPRHGQPPTFCVRLPGKRSAVIRGLPSFVKPQTRRQPAPVAPRSETSTDHDRNFAVRLPRRASHEKGKGGFTADFADRGDMQESFTTVEELSTKSPKMSIVSSAMLSVPESSANLSAPIIFGALSPTSITHPVAGSSHHVEVSSRAGLPHAPSQSIHDLDGRQHYVHSSTHETGPGRLVTQQTTERSVPNAEASTEEQRGEISAVERPEASQLTPLPINFPPSNQPSPPYGSPYGYAPSLPPGVALNPQGFAYEVATGRPVYLHPTPPPVPVFNPRPVAHTLSAQHSVSFVPGHLHHSSSMSPDFLAQPHTPPINGFMDPSMGPPLFSLPRQSSRVEIRAPSEHNEAKAKVERRPSSLRSAVAAEPFQPAQSDYRTYGQSSEYFPEMPGAPASGYQGSDSGAARDVSQVAQQQTIDPGVMGYPPYQQQYYYPEQYAYPQYAEMPQQMGQYDGYPSDPQQQQTPIYY